MRLCSYAALCALCPRASSPPVGCLVLSLRRHDYNASSGYHSSYPSQCLLLEMSSIYLGHSVHIILPQERTQRVGSNSQLNNTVTQHETHRTIS
ncbi:uncharacterized protein K460DRAFT_83034 [Cucurbitaria berberidis CBS 394.84]|uniref:Uncharacterized protein n=1 Tax=Cucurbitaria berberidis CBS 394.84 TaxID=1168544 RepID=A0A9P4GNZ8_9PLEO|nr:uncharacterized protein K460DRAFT_83034 [Cucurbitaria berberidis CBS 394.84]KAF1848939.1 hypothetical protein K460DRAFT_83034 [Cucurbitaria berberidis CBS 394.84]